MLKPSGEKDSGSFDKP